MGGKSRFSDDDVLHAIERIVSEGDTPTVAKVLTLCPISRTRVQQLLKHWNIQRTAGIVERADIPDKLLSGITDSVKTAFSEVVLAERRAAREAYQSQITSLSELVDETSRTTEELEAEKSQLQEALDKKVSEYRELDSEMMKREGEYRTLANQILKEREKADALTGKIAKLEETIATLEGSNSDDMKAQIIHLETRLQDEQKRREIAESKEHETSNLLAVATERVRQLEELVKVSSQKIDAITEQLKVAEKKNEDLLQDVRIEKSRYSSIVASLQKIGIEAGERRPWTDDAKRKKKNKRSKQDDDGQPTETPKPDDKTEQQPSSHEGDSQQITGMWQPKKRERQQLPLIDMSAVQKHSNEDAQQPIATPVKSSDEQSDETSQTVQTETDSTDSDAQASPVHEDGEPPISYSPLPQEQVQVVQIVTSNISHVGSEQPKTPAHEATEQQDDASQNKPDAENTENTANKAAQDDVHTTDVIVRKANRQS